jgi:hypothetical protein
MRFYEFVTEHATPLTLGSYSVQVDPHAIKRTQERKIDPEAVDILLHRVPGAKPKIKRFKNGQRFWLYNKDLNVSLGISVVDQEQRILRLKTVIPGHAWADLVPTVEVF